MKKSASSLDRRQHPRAPVSLAVELKDDHGFSIHSAHDLSTGGVFFDRAIPHAVGETIELSFTLPGDERAIRCRGEVVNVPDATDYGMGVRFMTMKPTDLKKLEEFIKTHQEETTETTQ